VISLPLILGVHAIFGADFIEAAVPLPAVPRFQFEHQAQQHCPADAVVWAITRSGVYTTNGERWYGQTDDGTFTCLLDAQKAGYRATHVAR
jgi:hypothetical protein